MSSPSSSDTPAARLGDFTTDRRVLLLMALAVAVGLAGVAAAWVLLRLITLCTNLAYYGRLSLDTLPMRARRWAPGRCWCRWRAA